MSNRRNPRRGGAWRFERGRKPATTTGSRVAWLQSLPAERRLAERRSPYLYLDTLSSATTSVYKRHQNTDWRRRARHWNPEARGWKPSKPKWIRGVGPAPQRPNPRSTCKDCGHKGHLSCAAGR